jgi:hypothetical protein
MNKESFNIQTANETSQKKVVKNVSSTRNSTEENEPTVEAGLNNLYNGRKCKLKLYNHYICIYRLYTNSSKHKFISTI